MEMVNFFKDTACYIFYLFSVGGSFQYVYSFTVEVIKYF